MPPSRRWQILPQRPESKAAAAFRIHTPLIALTKAEIIRKGLAWGWITPEPTPATIRLRTALACGCCDSCRLRLKGFAEAGLQDPAQVCQIRAGVKGDHVKSAMSRMPDIQKSGDTRNIAIDKVGVKDISYPIVVMDRKKKFQHTIARINMYVDLPHQFKGTHMSRFIEILNSYREEIALDKLEIMLAGDEEKTRRDHCPPGDGVPLLHREKSAGLKGKEPDGVHLLILPQPWRRSSTSSSASGFRSPRSAPAARSCQPTERTTSAPIISIKVQYSNFIWIEELVSLVEELRLKPCLLAPEKGR